MKALVANASIINFHFTTPQVCLVVNVASECGYTESNYKSLVQLQQDYGGGGEEFTVLAFPSNQFGGQEPGTNKQIISFARGTYGADFPIFSKTNVTGDRDSMCEAYRYLTDETGSFPSWNFCKYLVDRRGGVAQYFAVADDFSEMRASIEYLLKRPVDEL